MSNGFKRLFKGKHSFTCCVTMNYFESVRLELAVSFGFAEVFEQIQS